MAKKSKKKPLAGLASLLGKQVVLDTSGPLLYLGTLAEVRPEGYWLENADLRDSSEGLATKEGYACEARENGIRANRRRLFVLAHVVTSVSALEDILLEFDGT